MVFTRISLILSLGVWAFGLVLPVHASTTVSANELTELLDAEWNNGAGRSVSSAGDVNGDGYDDFLIGAYGNDEYGETSGAAYLLYGSAEALTGGSLSVYAKFSGELSADNAGTSVSSAGDVNGDGFDDFLVGASGNDDAGSGAGAAYLIYGQSTAYTGDISLSTVAEFSGELLSDTAGASVSSAGDVNGDGFDDFLVGASGDDDGGSSAGAAYLIYGQSAAYTGTTSLGTIAKFTGESAADGVGISTSISSAGDVNNDGYDDVVVGAYGDDDVGSRSGAAYLIYGQSAAYTGTTSLSTMAKFTGEVTNDRSGYAVSTAGDVNNDGYDDVLVSAYLNDDTGTNAGAVYLIYGQSTAYTGVISLSTMVEFTGEVASDSAGFSVSTAGDVNNDGYDDVLVGAYGNDDAATTAGAAYLIYGQSTAYTGVISLGTMAEFTGEAESDTAGYSVSTAGDVNGDGFDDFLIGASGNDDAGASAGAGYLVYGQASTYTGATSLSASIEFFGESADTHYIFNTFKSAGDVNGDGYDDMLVGAHRNDDVATNAGAVFLIYSSAEGLDASSFDSAVEFTGEADSDYAGVSVAPVGDVNGDGYDDVLVGAYLNDDATSSAGAAYLIYGQSAAYTGTISLGTMTEFTGEADSDYAGYVVSGAGDVNGDGYDDMLVGAYRNDDAAIDAGAVYLIYGQSAAYTGTISLGTMTEFTGEAESDYAGIGVAPAGDVNNDGFDDILVGAYGNDDAAIDAGAAYLIYGQSIAYTGTISFGTMAEFTGEAEDLTVGDTISFAGDVNNDGFDDFLVGAYGNDDAAIDAGAVYLIYGQSTAYTGTISLGTMAEFTGEAESDYAGVGIASAGDVNNDGYDDVLVSAYGNDAVGVDSGSVYLIFGSSTQLTSQGIADVASIVFQGVYGNDNLGYGVATAGDTNHDGYDEIILGSQVDSAGPLYIGYLYIDQDADGLFASESVLGGTDLNDNDGDNDGVETNTDCNDADVLATVEMTYYVDSDSDGLGEVGTETLFCAASAPEGYSDNALDTNDAISNAGVEIPDDGVDNDGDSEIDEVNTIDDNGLHPTFGTEEVTSTSDYADAVLSIEGAKKGKIKVTYADNSTYSFVVFSSFTKDTKTKIKSFDDTGLVLVLHPKGKKLALVNVYTGEVYDRVILSKKKKYTKNSFKIVDVRGDGSLEVLVTSKRDSDKIRLSLIKVKTSTLSLKKKDSEILTLDNVKVSKTKKHKKDLLLRNKKGKTIATYDVGKKYKLTFSE